MLDSQLYFESAMILHTCCIVVMNKVSRVTEQSQSSNEAKSALGTSNSWFVAEIA
jgi:hypothetical protein